MWLLRAWLDDKIKASQRFAEIMFSCATCGNCVTHCAFPEFRDRLLLAFTAGKEAFLDAGQVPPTVRDYLTKIQLHGNAYGKSIKKSMEWLNDADDFKDHTYLLFTDDVGNFDPRGQEIVRSVVSLLQKAGISFGVIKGELNTDANDVKAMGETPLFEELAAKNIEILNKNNVKQIITLSPHSFNALKNDYPALGGQYQVFHYTQVLAFAMGGLNFSQLTEKIAVAYHDPCYLGRHNTDYESARTVLRSTPGITLVEMDRNRQNALCCGGGGGNFFTDILSGSDDSSSRARIREAAGAGAKILAVACPMCAVMLEDAVKVENMDGQIQVQEVSEIVNHQLL